MASCNCQEECQCARCGSSASSEDCEWCPACGWYEDNDPDCHACQGTGIAHYCLSDADWCNAHPLPGRESIKRGEIEWFKLHEKGCLVPSDGQSETAVASVGDQGADDPIGPESPGLL